MAEENAKKGRGTVFLLVIVLAVLAAAGGAGYFFLFGGKGGADKPGSPASQKEEPLATVTLEPFLVNLVDGNYRRYLKATLTLEYNGEAVAKDLEAQNYRVRDAIIGTLRSKRVEELQDQEALRAELVQVVNGLLPDVKIRNLYFQELVIQ